MNYSELPNKSAFTCGRGIFIKVNERQYFNPAGMTLRTFPNPNVECELKIEEPIAFFAVQPVFKSRRPLKQFSRLVKYAYFIIDGIDGVQQKLDDRFALNLETFDIVDTWGLTMVRPVSIRTFREFN